MKPLLILLSLAFISSLAHARNCPTDLTFAANKVSVVQNNLLKAKLELIESSHTKCSYRGVDQNGDYVSASIHRGTRRGSTSKGTLYINFDCLELKTVTKLKNISSRSVTIESSSYRGVKKAKPTTVYSTSTNKVVAITKAHTVKVN